MRSKTLYTNNSDEAFKSDSLMKYLLIGWMLLNEEVFRMELAIVMLVDGVMVKRC